MEDGNKRGEREAEEGRVYVKMLGSCRTRKVIANVSFSDHSIFLTQTHEAGEGLSRRMRLDSLCNQPVSITESG